MGRSFFDKKPYDVYVGANAFATLIAATPTAYGLTSTQATAFGAVNTAYREAFDKAEEPATRTSAAIAGRNTALAALRTMASDLAKIIQGTATVTDEQKLELGLSVRGTRSPVAPPGTPDKFTATLVGNGDVLLKWKCQNPPGSQGTMYQVWRKVDDEAEYKFLNGVGQKKYVDMTLPEGAVNVTYQIQAVRSTAAGFWGTFNLRIGKSSSGATTATVTEAPKLAA